MFTVTTDSGDVVGEQLLVATGRRVDLAALGAGALGVDESGRALPIDDHCRVEGADRVWAVGDVTGKGAFTHVAMYQAGIVVADLLGKDRVWGSYAALPRVTFTDPEVGAVGLTEAGARDAGIDVATAVTDLGASTRGWIAKAHGIVKLVADRRPRRAGRRHGRRSVRRRGHVGPGRGRRRRDPRCASCAG